MLLGVVLDVVDLHHVGGLVAGGAGGHRVAQLALGGVVAVAGELVGRVGGDGDLGRLADPALGGLDGFGGVGHGLGLGGLQGVAEVVLDLGLDGVLLGVVLDVVEINNLAVAINC